jgi:hypothetical protein
MGEIAGPSIIYAVIDPEQEFFERRQYLPEEAP